MIKTANKLIVNKSSLKTLPPAVKSAAVYNKTGRIYLEKLFALAGLNIFSSFFKIALNNHQLGSVSNKLISVISTKKKQLLQQQRAFLEFKILHKFYKGIRYAAGLPARGQRTHTNARTARKKIRI